jgi:hypothetical protein
LLTIGTPQHQFLLDGLRGIAAAQRALHRKTSRRIVRVGDGVGRFVKQVFNDGASSPKPSRRC